MAGTTINFADQSWYYETGATLVGVISFVQVSEETLVKIPNYDFAFAPDCDPRDQGAVEDEIRAQISKRFPELFPKEKRNGIRRTKQRS